jgi:hypothetical protein
MGLAALAALECGLPRLHIVIWILDIELDLVVRGHRIQLYEHTFVPIDNGCVKPVINLVTYHCLLHRLLTLDLSRVELARTRLQQEQSLIVRLSR